MKKTDLKNYAKLIVKTGINVQKGQDVIIQASVRDFEFVEMVVEECYKAKARKVGVDWSYQPIAKLSFQKQNLKTITDIPEWIVEKYKHRAETLPCLIWIDSDDPDGLKGVDSSKLMQYRQALMSKIKKYRDAMDGKYQWNIVSIPSVEWARKVFPDASSKKQAVDLLWEAIFKCARLTGDPIKNWEEHNKNLKEKMSILNNLKIKTLEYKSSNGTDFTIDLLKNTHFNSGADTTLSGVKYNPNIPSEECFISPDKSSAKGVVMATKPLSVLGGNVVKDFGFRFENGKIVEIIAKDDTDKKILEDLIAVDEGAKMLGEVALVPFDSPINQTGILFYNTLFDENACCHLAIGKGFSDTIDNYEKMSEDDIKGVGLNDSMIHVDFMIGSSDLSIIADTYDGKKVQIFKNGVWAI